MSERRRLRAGAQPTDEPSETAGYAHLARDLDAVLHLVEMCPGGLQRCDRADVLHRWHTPPALLAELQRRHPIRADRGDDRG